MTEQAIRAEQSIEAQRKKLQKLKEHGLLWAASSDSKLPEETPTEAFSSKKQIAKLCPFELSAIDEHVNAMRFGAVHEWIYKNSRQVARSSLGSLSPHLVASFMALRAFRHIAAEQYEKNGRCSKCIAFIGKESWPSAFLLQQSLNFQVEGSTERHSLLPHVLLLNPKSAREHFWLVDTALRSPALPVVVSNFQQLPFPRSRRLSIAAAKGGALGFLFLSEKATRSHSAADTRWSISHSEGLSPHPCFELELLKIKGQQSAVRNWRIEVFRQHSFLETQEHEKISLRIPAPLEQRSLPQAKNTSQQRNSEQQPAESPTNSIALYG